VLTVKILFKVSYALSLILTHEGGGACVCMASAPYGFSHRKGKGGGGEYKCMHRFTSTILMCIYTVFAITYILSKYLFTQNTLPMPGYLFIYMLIEKVFT